MRCVHEQAHRREAHGGTDRVGGPAHSHCTVTAQLLHSYRTLLHSYRMGSIDWKCKLNLLKKYKMSFSDLILNITFLKTSLVRWHELSPARSQSSCGRWRARRKGAWEGHLAPRLLQQRTARPQQVRSSSRPTGGTCLQQKNFAAHFVDQRGRKPCMSKAPPSGSKTRCARNFRRDMPFVLNTCSVLIPRRPRFQSWVCVAGAWPSPRTWAATWDLDSIWSRGAVGQPRQRTTPQAAFTTFQLCLI